VIVAIEEYFLPETLDEALSLISADDSSVLVMAGGTLTMPLINGGISAPDKVMGLRRVGLDYVRKGNRYISIGATATLTQMLDLDEIPLLQEAARNTGAWITRNVGTVGGNLFAPPPAGDFAVALLALDARVKLVREGGERTIPLVEFYTGFMSNRLQPSELLVEIQVPTPLGKTAYIKYGRKQANTPAVVTVAVRVVFSGGLVEDARIALGAVGPHPSRDLEAEASLVGKALDEGTIARAAELAAGGCKPFTDAIASAWYRHKMVEIYVSRALSQIAEGG
jgi:CO/xanthine dehydrogenase FAD-binding subunit